MLQRCELDQTALRQIQTVGFYGDAVEPLCPTEMLNFLKNRVVLRFSLVLRLSVFIFFGDTTLWWVGLPVFGNV
jgi:hypothetical protein